MAKSTKRGKSRAKKPKSKRPKKIAAAKKPRPRSRKAGASRSLAAAKPVASEKNMKIVRKALQGCMDDAGHSDFDPGENPGTYSMDTDAWESLLGCICSKIGVKLTATLLKDTISLSFSTTVGILAAKMK